MGFIHVLNVVNIGLVFMQREKKLSHFNSRTKRTMAMETSSQQNRKKRKNNNMERNKLQFISLFIDINMKKLS